MSKAALEFDAVTKRYVINDVRGRTLSLRDEIAGMFSRRRRSGEEFWALKDVSFQVPRGEAVGVIGRNGAGKSTLLKLISRITPPTSGRMTIRGRVASLLEVGAGFHAELTGRENIYLNGAILGMTRREIAARFDSIVDFSEVGGFLDTPVKRYSSGMYVRLAFAVAAHLDADIMLIDEVLAVGDSSFQRKCLTKIGEVASSGRTVLIVSHNLGPIANLCPHSVMLDKGRSVAYGKTTDIIEKYIGQLTERASAVSLGERTDRQGNGEIRVQHVRFLDSRGQVTTTLQTGSRCALEFAYTGERQVRDLALAWNVRDQFGQPIFRLSSHDTGNDSGTFDANGVLTCTVPKLPLAPGRYYATIELRVRGEVADYVEGAFVVDVEDGDFYGSGRLTRHSPVLLEHSWHVSRCA